MDSVFKALADPSRRDLLDALRREDGQTLSQLEAALPMSRFGTAKHLKVLEEAGLVTRVKRGRFTHHYLNAVPLAEALGRWIEPYKMAPAVRGVLDLKARLEGTMEPKPDYVMSTFIRCTQDALWDALTQAEAARHYHPFTPEAVRDGDALVYKLPDGSDMLVCRERSLTPKTRIEATFEPKWAPDIPASRFVWLIDPQGEFCRLTIEHYDIPPGGEGYVEGWERLVAGLKTWLETGESVRFSEGAA
ncbi:ArsR/SmtB family transcription factor [Jannaschia ovalis]|uniref:Metalloregulator ArsR/SmtB family transcription factor n=1 Tax=Jannaschia ovalis TaxID=3038773 RepID=A0ABY8LDU1_9RHOB|nr:metalloregulator ArsR/SmtB family transcription factor [Jannaschia sp. GRR-S6-38]WGH78782.1 metalloregulator ArsR/SmtB family transcription factor [Jannaschia sp. GRR-S6-38]